jgi:hypothetical protein
MMCGLQLLRGLGEQESAPIAVAAHNALLAEDDGAGGFGDSDSTMLERIVYATGTMVGGWHVLFYFGEAAWPDL